VALPGAHGNSCLPTLPSLRRCADSSEADAPGHLGKVIGPERSAGQDELALLMTRKTMTARAISARSTLCPKS
jgi:hypothetical protein